MSSAHGRIPSKTPPFRGCQLPIGAVIALNIWDAAVHKHMVKVSCKELLGLLVLPTQLKCSYLFPGNPPQLSLNMKLVSSYSVT